VRGERCVISWGRCPRWVHRPGAHPGPPLAASSTEGLPHPGLCAAERLSLFKPTWALRGSVTVVLFFPEPRQGIVRPSVTGLEIEPATRRCGPGLGARILERIVPTPQTFGSPAASAPTKRILLGKGQKRLGPSDLGLAGGGWRQMRQNEL
jgi:hypothetical protein